MYNHRDEKLDKFIGKRVRVAFKDEHVMVGYLEYVDEFSSKYAYRKPNMYSLTLSSGAGYVSFRKGLVKSIDEV